MLKGYYDWEKDPDRSTDQSSAPRNVYNDRIYEKTVRTKYASIQIGDDISHFTRLDMKQKFSDIREISLYFKDMGLNSDDNMAGAIAIRFGDGMLTNASKTDKCNITEDRICYLKDYNSKGNQVYWAGSKLPSSESPISFLAFQEFPDANILLHFHYKPITYSDKLAMYRTKKYVEYGTYNEAKTLVSKLKETGGFAIAQGHGEFVVASDMAEVKAKISEIIAMIS